MSKTKHDYHEPPEVAIKPESEASGAKSFRAFNSTDFVEAIRAMFDCTSRETITRVEIRADGMTAFIKHEKG